jgi:hypothetical protein
MTINIIIGIREDIALQNKIAGSAKKENIKIKNRR